MLNKVMLMGRITSDLKLKTTQSGVSVLGFGLAVEKNFAGASGKRETDFFNLTAWRGTAEFIAKYFEKGSLITVVGELSTREWEDKEKLRHKETEVVVSEAYFTGTKNGGEAPSTPKAPKEVAAKPAKEELPFSMSEDENPWGSDDD